MPQSLLTHPPARQEGVGAGPHDGTPAHQTARGPDLPDPSPPPVDGAGGRKAMAVALTLALVLAAALAVWWAQGGMEDLAARAMAAQREAQNAMAGALRALRGGEAGALAGLLALAFSYGVVHAAGPGHGKLLIGGYGAATRVRLVPLAAIALASSLAQASVAVALVHGAVVMLEWTRAEVVALGEGALTTASTAAIGLIGLWLVWRGGRGLWRLARPRPTLTHTACPDCGHRHGPAPEEIARLTSWREALALVAAIAIRPCTGALFLLILTWRMDIAAAGIAGAYAMGLGTALVTVGVAVLSVTARDGALMWAGRLGGLRPLAPALELAVGLLVALLAAQALRLGL